MTMVSLPAAATSFSPQVEDFVDLYALLKAEPDAPTDQLRARISALYLEAQRNLDHHNFRKRFYYQQLFEVHLPQAYESLLEPSRRAHYDACLAAHHRSEPFPLAPNAQSSDLVLPALSDTPFTESIAVSNTPDSHGSAPAPDSVPPISLPVIEPEVALRSQAASAARAASPPSAERTDTEQTGGERRRDDKRRELIKSEVQTASWAWGSVGGAAMVGASLIALAVGVPLIQHAWLIGFSTSALWMGGLLLCALIAGAAFMVTSRFVRRMVVNDLSRMPYEELLRRCSQK